GKAKVKSKKARVGCPTFCVFTFDFCLRRYGGWAAVAHLSVSVPNFFRRRRRREGTMKASTRFRLFCAVGLIPTAVVLGSATAAQAGGVARDLQRQYEADPNSGR